jgi:hypothetical protein
MLRKTMVCIMLSAALLAAVAYAGPGKGKGKKEGSGEKINEVIPFTRTLYVECIDDMVELDGYVHHVASSRRDGDGKIHVHDHWNLRGVRGEGISTGIKYKGVGATNYTFIGKEPFPYTRTLVNNFGLIAPGPGNDLHIHVVVHTTINAKGEITAQIDGERTTCGEGG